MRSADSLIWNAYCSVTGKPVWDLCVVIILGRGLNIQRIKRFGNSLVNYKRWYLESDAASQYPEGKGGGKMKKSFQFLLFALVQS